MRSILVTLLIAIVLARVPALAQWRDPTPHRVQFVTVDSGVQLEVLDWGGTGQPVVLLTGSGHTAHVYDEFAPALRDCCHVYAITRRGYGASTRPDTGDNDQRLADDVLRVLDQMQIRRPVLVGHSMAGGDDDAGAPALRSPCGACLSRRAGGSRGRAAGRRGVGDASETLTPSR